MFVAGIELLAQVELELLQLIERRRLELLQALQVGVRARVLALREALHHFVQILRVDAGRLQLLTERLRVAIQLLELACELTHVVAVQRPLAPPIGAGHRRRWTASLLAVLVVAAALLSPLRLALLTLTLALALLLTLGLADHPGPAGLVGPDPAGPAGLADPAGLLAADPVACWLF